MLDIKNETRVTMVRRSLKSLDGPPLSLCDSPHPSTRSRPFCARPAPIVIRPRPPVPRTAQTTQLIVFSIHGHPIAAHERRAARDPRPRTMAAGAGQGALERGAVRALRGARARRRRGDRRAAAARLPKPRRGGRALGRLPPGAGGARARAAAAALGAAFGPRRRQRERGGAPPTAAGWPGGAHSGFPRGPAAGRSGRAERSTSERAPPTRSSASCKRSGLSRPRACGARRWCACPTSW